MIHFPDKERYGWDDLLEIVRDLRSPEGCPWDRAQTHASIRRNFLEETCEALDAIDHDDADNMREELGDVLLQVAFHAQMERERGRFDMSDVVDAYNGKELKRDCYFALVAEEEKRIADGAATTVVLRPESTALGDEGFFPVRVAVSSFMGAYQLYHVLLGDTKLIIHEYNPKGKKVYGAGETAYVRFEPGSAHCI